MKQQELEEDKKIAKYRSDFYKYLIRTLRIAGVKFAAVDDSRDNVVRSVTGWCDDVSQDAPQRCFAGWYKGAPHCYAVLNGFCFQQNPQVCEA